MLSDARGEVLSVDKSSLKTVQLACNDFYEIFNHLKPIWTSDALSLIHILGEYLVRLLKDRIELVARKAMAKKDREKE